MNENTCTDDQEISYYFIKSYRVKSYRSVDMVRVWLCVCVWLGQAYEDDDRRVRKAGVDVLVKLYQRVGELLWTYINDISDAKVKNVSTLCTLWPVNKSF